jgi:hypothetical protein
MRRPLFKGIQGAGTTIAVPFDIVAGCVGLHISWPDAVTEASFVVEVTAFDSDQAPWGTGAVLAGDGNAQVAVADPQKWPDSGAVIAPVVAGAPGARLFLSSGLRMQRGRLLITSTAICTWEIRSGIPEV